MKYSTHFHNDFFGVLFPHPDEVECILHAIAWWDWDFSKPA